MAALDSESETGQTRQSCRELARCAEEIIRAASAATGSADQITGAFGRLSKASDSLQFDLAQVGLLDVGAGIVEDMSLALRDPDISKSLVSVGLSLQQDLANALQRIPDMSGTGIARSMTDLAERAEALTGVLPLLGEEGAVLAKRLDLLGPAIRGVGAVLGELFKEGKTVEESFEDFNLFNEDIPRLRQLAEGVSEERRRVIQRQIGMRAGAAKVEVDRIQSIRSSRLADLNTALGPAGITSNLELLEEEVRNLGLMILDITERTNDPQLRKLLLELERNLQRTFLNVTDSARSIGFPERSARRPSDSRLLRDEGVVLHSKQASEISFLTEANFLNAESLAAIRDNAAQLPSALDAAVQSAVAWREESLAGLDQTMAGYEDFARVVDETFNQMVVRSLEDSLPLLREFSDGARQAFEDYANSATNLSGQVEGIIGGALMNMENALVQFVQTGKLNFSQLVDSLLADLIRLTIRAAILGPLARALGSVFGPASFLTSASGGSPGVPLDAAVGLRHGGSFVVPGSGGIDSVVPIFRATPGEAVSVTPRGEGSGGSVVNVNVVNNSGAEVETRERSNGFGGRDIEVLIGEAVARDLRGGGPAFRAVRDTFGAGARPIGR